MANAKTPNCMNRIGSQALRSSVQDEAGSGATVGAVSIAALAPGTYEAEQTGYTVTIPLVSGGRQLTITSTEIEFVHGRFVHQITFNGNGVSSRRYSRCTSYARPKPGPEPFGRLPT